LVTDEGLIGLSVIARELPVIDMDELGTEGAPTIDEAVQAVPAPQPNPATAPTRTMPQRISRLEEEVHGLRERERELGEQCEVLDTINQDFSRFTTWTVGRLSQLLDASGMSYTSYGDYHIPY
ncbi:hypothetical protein Tco_1382030, partial [Tanacetum coccineum]